MGKKTNKFKSDFAAAKEYVADIITEKDLPERVIVSRTQAAENIEKYLNKRVEAVCKRLPERPVVLLSGGVDSMVVAAQLVTSGHNPVCVTVNFEHGSSIDKDPAAQFAKELKLEHINMEVDERTTLKLTKETIRDLQDAELWEVAAGVPLKAAFTTIKNEGFTNQSPVFTGGGADVILAGGWAPKSPPYSASGNQETHEHIWSSIQRSFQQARYIPDFYERVLKEQEHQHIQTFQTVGAWEATAKFTSKVLYTPNMTEGTYFDKACMRDTAVRLGVPPHLAWVKKSPLQVSSGLFGAFTLSARKWVAEQKGSSVYGDPVTEPAEVVLSRAWLTQIGNETLPH